MKIVLKNNIDNVVCSKISVLFSVEARTQSWVLLLTLWSCSRWMTVKTHTSVLQSPKLRCYSRIHQTTGPCLEEVKILISTTLLMYRLRILWHV